VFKISNLDYSYDKTPFIENLSFEIADNQIVGFLGANGAGKTTIIECLEGVKKVKKGDLFFDDIKIDNNFKKHISIQFQDAAFFIKLKVKEIFKLAADLLNYNNDYRLIMHKFDLLNHQNKYYEKLSGGMKQKVAVAVAIMNTEAKVIFLDEPTRGLDIFSRKKLWKAIRNIKEQGKTVILTTHYIEEAEELCDSIIILDRGRIIEYDSPQELNKKYCKSITILIEVVRDIDVEDLVKNNAFIKNVKKGNANSTNYEILIDSSNASSSNVDKLISFLIKRKYKIVSLNVKKYNLETAFLNIIGYRLDEKGDIIEE
jgi:ABC-2 type transport system ATP-binding protein